jgi:glucose-1-phosphate thymidylyltransferase
MPDTLIEPSDAFARLLAAHIDREDDVTLGLFKTSRPQKFGMVELDQEHNIVYCIDKPDRTHLDYLWGLAVWNYRFTQLLHEFVSQSSAQGVTSEVVLSTVFSRAIALNFKVRGVPFEDGFYFDIGTADDLWLTMTHILKNKPIPGK